MANASVAVAHNVLAPFLRGQSVAPRAAALMGAGSLIVIEGIGRYRTNPDANERRRIQIVVFTGA